MKTKIDYSITPVHFYKFECLSDSVNNTYVGHTTNWRGRKAVHKDNCNNEHKKNHSCKVYQVIRENGGWENWRMVEIEKRICVDRRDAERIEQSFINQLNANMNLKKSFETPEESQERRSNVCAIWRETNKDHVVELGKAWREKNHDKIKEYCENDVLTVMEIMKKSCF